MICPLVVLDLDNNSNDKLVLINRHTFGSAPAAAVDRCSTITSWSQLDIVWPGQLSTLHIRLRTNGL